MLVHIGRTLFPPGQGPARYCWSFECLRAYVAARPDGVCLALLVENAHGVQFARIQETLEAFIELVPEDENHSGISVASPAHNRAAHSKF